MGNCADCYYRGQVREQVMGMYYCACDYCLYTEVSRDCDVKGCNKFDGRPKDRNALRGCGMCEFFDKNGDEFICRKTQEKVWSYKPSCKEYFVKKIEKVVTYNGNL